MGERRMIKIRDNLYQGGLDDLNMHTLMIEKFDFVVCVAKELEEYLPRYIEWEWDSDNFSQPMTYFYAYHGLIDDSINQKKDVEKNIALIKEKIDKKYKILVMCAAGMSMSPYVCARYLSMIENRTMDDVYEEFKKIMYPDVDTTPLRCNDERIR